MKAEHHKLSFNLHHEVKINIHKQFYKMHLAYSITTDFLAFKGAVCKKIFFFLSPLHPIRQTAIAVQTMHKLSLSP